MALLNNFLELRSDAFKMTVHNRRPIPARTDTIGPWLDALTFLTWLSALTNSALVYLFCPRSQSQCSATPSANSTQLDKVHQHLFSASGAQAPDSGADADLSATRELLLTALLIALAASHGYMILRVVVRHVVEKIAWKGSEEVKEREKEDKNMKEKFLKGFLVEEDRERSEGRSFTDKGTDIGATSRERDGSAQGLAPAAPDLGDGTGFWDNDEGLEEISRVSKEV